MEKQNRFEVTLPKEQLAKKVYTAGKRGQTNRRKYAKASEVENLIRQGNVEALMAMKPRQLNVYFRIENCMRVGALFTVEVALYKSITTSAPDELI